MSVVRAELSEADRQRIWDAARELLRNKDAFSLEEGVREAIKAQRVLDKVDEKGS